MPAWTECPKIVRVKIQAVTVIEKLENHPTLTRLITRPDLVALCDYTVAINHELKWITLKCYFRV
jgi:hypothetical protein